MNSNHLTFILAGLVASSLFFRSAVNPPVPSPNAATLLADTLKKDAESGLVLDTNLYMVKAQCTSCHSSKLIIANRFTRDGWRQKIRWMQAKHNLWELGDAEKQVLDYLEKYYAPTEVTARRAPLKNIQWYKLEQ